MKSSPESCPNCGGYGSDGRFIVTGQHGGGEVLGHTCQNSYHKLVENKERPYFEPIEQEWEKPVADAAEKILKRLYKLTTGKDVPESEILSPAMLSVIDHEIRVLVNELTEHWY